MSNLTEYQYILLELFDVELKELEWITPPTKNFSTMSVWKEMTETQFNCLYYLLHGLSVPFPQRYSMFVFNVVIYNNKINKAKIKQRSISESNRQSQKEYREKNREVLREKNRIRYHQNKIKGNQNGNHD